MRGKIVRKLAAAGLSAVVAVSASVPVFAADKSYSISEIGDMNISLPEDITVIDRNAPDSAEYFKLFGLDYNTVMSQMDSNNVYLQGMDSTASLTVTVSMTESADSQELENYNLLSSEQLGDIARNFLSQPEYTACRIDEAGKPVTWLSFDTNVGGVKAYLANTVYDGRSINLTVQRAGKDATDDDYNIFTSAVSSVSFGTKNFLQKYWLCLAIAAAALIVLLVLLILIIKTVRSLRTQKKQQKENDKILEELSGKYSRRTAGKPSDDDNPAATKVIPVQNKTAPPEPEEAAPEEVQPVPDEQQQTPPEVVAEDYDDYDDEPRSKFTDEQLAEMLGEEFATDEPYVILPTEPEPVPGEEPEVVKEYVRQPKQAAQPEEQPADEPQKQPEEAEPEEDDFFAGANFTDGEAEPDEEPEAEPGVEAAAEPEPEAEPVEEAAEVIEADRPELIEQPESEPVPEEEPEAETEPEPIAEEVLEQAFEEAAENAKPLTNAEPEPAGEFYDEDDGDDDDDGEPEAEPDELEEYMNDEVLVREDAKSNKFRDSSDFFEEAPRKSMGVLSSRDIQDAEEYDVIGEEEKRAEKVKRDEPAPKKKKKKKSGGFKGFALGFLAGAKYFFVHCGYFITNVYRLIKRKHKIRKRKKAEEERRRRARERAAQQRARAAQRERQQRENGGLVQVHSRDDRRPPSGQQRRPSGSPQRRPSGSAQRRPSGSQQRRPQQKRRPAGSQQRRPQQKRRPPERR
ncbi:MAG: hypothetical protein II082_05590 [Ruminococcus sp.]|nr:hypothetical protein [Ruminococcus sp.]MBR0337494.1 hypothetical protein [Ruminococcus sp.]